MNRSYPKQNRILRILPLLIFFLLSLFYFFRITDYIFFYQEKSSLFLFSFQYLLEHLNQPGGFLIYLGELQTTFYYYPFVGAVLVSLEICLIIVLTSKIGKILSGRSIFIIPYLMGAVLFYLQTNYQYSSFNNLGVLIQLLSFFVILKYLKGKFIWIPVVLFPLQYFLFGSFLFILLMLFSIFILLNEKQKGWIKLAILYSFSLGFFFMGKEFLFFQTTNTLLVYPYSAQGVGWQSTLFITAIISISILPLLFLITAKRLSSFSFKKIALIQFVPFLIIFALVFLAVPRIDKKNREYFHVAKLFYQQKYDEIIEFNRQFPSTNILTNFLNNVALSETGQLSNSFFSFPQSADGGTLFLKWEIVSEVLKRGGYFYYNLGMINEAQRWAYEYMVMRGNSPEALKMLIKTDLINGNFKIAKKYITILKQSLFYRKQALEYEELLFNETAINNHPELGRKTQLKTTQDFFVISDDPSANLDLILEADSMNIIAMEYKLSKLLLQKDMQGIVDELPNLEKMGYSKIPKNVEEAVVTYKMLKVGEMPKLKRLKINRQTEQRFQQYYKIYQQNQANKQQAQRVLMPNFGDTYWYYVFFK